MSQFWARLNKYVSSFQNTKISYISVPERTKKERWHIHALIYNLPPQIVQNERVSRHIQNLYRSGFLHLDIARDKSPKIASYMAKYLSKFMQNNDNERVRAYNCSRNIEKIRVYGTNSNNDIISNEIVPDGILPKVSSYNTKYLGQCLLYEYKFDNMSNGSALE